MSPSCTHTNGLSKVGPPPPKLEHLCPLCCFCLAKHWVSHFFPSGLCCHPWFSGFCAPVNPLRWGPFHGNSSERKNLHFSSGSQRDAAVGAHLLPTALGKAALYISVSGNSYISCCLFPFSFGTKLFWLLIFPYSLSLSFLINNANWKCWEFFKLTNGNWVIGL